MTATRRDVAWMLVVVLLLGVVWIARGDRAGAQASPEGVDTVFVVVSTDYADALAVGSLAGSRNAPVVLVPTNPPIPGATQILLTELDPKRVVIVGGTAVISDAMETALTDLLPLAEFERRAGANRYATNALLATGFPLNTWASIPPSAFRASDGETMVFDGGSVYSPTNDAMYAPLDLPNNAILLNIVIAGVDNDAGTGGSGEGDDVIAEVQLVGSAGVSTVGCPPPVMTSSGEFTTVCSLGTNFEIDNTLYSYQLVLKGADGDPFVRTVTLEYRLGDIDD